MVARYLIGYEFKHVSTRRVHTSESDHLVPLAVLLLPSGTAITIIARKQIFCGQLDGHH
jgi:hypothetical protein